MIATLKRTMKALLPELLEKAGIEARLHRDRVLILTYHRVLPDDQISPLDPARALMVGAQAFAQNMDYLRRYFTPISFEDYLKGFTPDGRTRRVLVTFDDGWADNYHHAFPVLRRYDIPATIFLATGLIGRADGFWWHELGTLLARQDLSPEWAAKILDDIQGVSMSAADALKGWLRAPAVVRTEKIRQAVERLKECPAGVLQELVRRLRPSDGRGAAAVTLNWEQVEAMSKANISFGPHTVDHTILDRITEDEARRQIQTSWGDLQARPGVRSVPVFCYPGGNYNRGTLELVREAGLQAAVTVRMGSNVLHASGQYELRRLNIDYAVAHSEKLLRFLFTKAACGCRLSP